jgi:hypothetical protein
MSAGSSLRKGLSSHKNGGLATEKQRADALSLIAALNNRLQSVVAQLNAELTKVNEKIDGLARVCSALTKLGGEVEVTAEIQRQRHAELNEESSQIAEIIKKAVEAGTMVAGDTIEERSIVVSTERDPQGTIRQPEFIRTPLSSYVDEVRDLLVGKKVGDVVTMEDGSTITVVEVYQPVVKAQGDDVEAEEIEPKAQA